MNSSAEADGARFGHHPEEVVVALRPGRTLVWTTQLMHATEIQAGPGPRRVVEFRFRAADGPASKRSLVRSPADAVPHVFPGWQDWTDARKRLWGVGEPDAHAASL